MGTPVRGWAAVLLLAAVFLGHGLQCGSASGGAAHGVHSGDTSAVSAADAHLAGSSAVHGAGASAMAAPATSHEAATATTAGSAPGHRHGLPGHLWAACLAVLAAGLAVLLVLAAPRTLRPALPAASPARLWWLSWPTPLRPPDLLALCVLRT